MFSRAFARDVADFKSWNYQSKIEGRFFASVRRWTEKIYPAQFKEGDR